MRCETHLTLAKFLSGGKTINADFRGPAFHAT
jgi:hypothetical protein